MRGNKKEEESKKKKGKSIRRKETIRVFSPNSWYKLYNIKESNNIKGVPYKLRINIIYQIL